MTGLTDRKMAIGNATSGESGAITAPLIVPTLLTPVEPIAAPSNFARTMLPPPVPLVAIEEPLDSPFL